MYNTAMYDLQLRDARVLIDDEFLETTESEYLYANLIASTEWKQEYMRFYGNSVAIPRLTAWYGKEYNYSGIKNKPKDIPAELQNLIGKVESKTGVRYNSILLNLYRNGKDSVSFHADDEAELGVDPTIASISLGAARLFKLKHNIDKSVYSVMLRNGSLMLMGKGTQLNYTHAVPKDKSTKARINITMRFIYK